MPDDSGFLAAIAQSPADDTPRLVYADWLDERCDPRAEYVRLRVALRRRRYPGRATQLARLRALEPALDRDWVAAAFPAPRLSITVYRASASPVTDPVTKFGGQPVWLARPQWPLSRGHPERRMQFVCQVAIPDFLGVATARMAYLFVTHASAGERGNDDNWFFDPDEGESAVVLQPGGDKLRVKFSAVATGPTLYADDGSPCELVPEFAPGLDPARRACPDFADDEAFTAYHNTIWGEKVGGTSLSGNDNHDDIERLATDPGWRLLLSIYTRRRSPFCINLCVTCGFAFVSADGKRGVFMTE